jgi:hypothetical protein
MPEEIKINKHDYNRVVLTEVQPYELPFIVTNEGFYSYLKMDAKRLFINSLFDDFSETLPFDFKIIKTSNTFRKLSLIHPIGQSKFVDFYRKYNSLIKSQCSNSKFSIRHPVDIALHYFESDEKEIDSKLKDEGVDIHSDIEKSSPIYASSFFTYKKYNFLYKFYDSYVFHRIERKFHKLHKFDLSKCFENLSPDMLPTALRGEEVLRSKRDSKQSFESRFANLISYVNYGRNHGIVIGPEFSRIFAEILLQKIDKKIEVSLFEKDIKYGKDYVLKRYVDDYFLFYREDSFLDMIKSEVLNCLSDSKLFINESKDEYFIRPFITGVTSAKLSISDYFQDLFEKVEVSSNIESLTISSNFFNYSKLSNRNITKLKSVVDKHEINFESISGYFFTIMKRKITEINEVFNHSLLESKILSSLSRFLLQIIDIMFFVYSMDGRVRSTYLISEIIIQISEICKKLDYESELMISDKILQEAKFSIKNSLQGSDSVESLNLALSLQTLNTENSLTIEDVRKLINFTKKDDSLNYFQFVVGLYFIKHNSDFYALKMELCERAIQKISLSSKPMQDSELVHIIFDLFSCPFLTEKFKRNFFDTLLKLDVFPSKVSENTVYKELTGHNWFVDWSEISIKRLLKKKQLRSPY